MSKVYVILQGCKYEGSSILCVCDSFELAKVKLKEFVDKENEMINKMNEGESEPDFALLTKKADIEYSNEFDYIMIEEFEVESTNHK